MMKAPESQVVVLAAKEAFCEASTERKHTKHRKSHPPFSLRLSTDERQLLEAQAGNKPLGVYIRERLFGEEATKRRKSRKPSVDNKVVAELTAQLGRSRIPSNLNQLAKAVNTGTLQVTHATEEDLQSACAAIVAMYEALITALDVKASSS